MHADAVAEIGADLARRIAHRERSAERAPHVVFLRHGRVPEREDRVASEPVDRAAGPADRLRRCAVVPHEQRDDAVGRKLFGDRGVPAHVRVHDAHGLRLASDVDERRPRVDHVSDVVAEVAPQGVAESHLVIRERLELRRRRVLVGDEHDAVHIPACVFQRPRGRTQLGAAAARQRRLDRARLALGRASQHQLEDALREGLAENDGVALSYRVGLGRREQPLGVPVEGANASLGVEQDDRRRVELQQREAQSLFVPIPIPFHSGQSH